jgi:hypothetical protein
MKPSFSDVTNSSQFQKEASAMSRAHIFVASVVCIAMWIWSETQFGVFWFLIIPATWFAVSLFVAMPFMYLRIKLGLAIANTPRGAGLISNLLDLASYIANPVIIYYALRFIHTRFF